MKQFDSFRLDTAKECLWHNDTEIPLPPKPFAVLRYLVDHPGRLITHDELLDALWPETYVQPQVLRTYVLELRKVLGDDSAEPRFIQTMPKRGYCFIAPVAETHTGAAPQSAPSGAQSSVIVGRDDELGWLQARLASLSTGRRQIVLLTGEAGIGKTALLDAFCRQVASSPSLIVARGQCVEGFGATEDYYPVVEALRQLCASPDGDLACRVFARLAPGWLSALGREAEPLPPAAANSALHPAPDSFSHSGAFRRVPGDLCAALEELSTHKPLLFVLEDLHWADSATLDLVSALARRRAPARLMLLAACIRPDFALPLKSLIQDLLMRELCTEMILPPLTKSALRELLSRELQQDPPPSGLTSFVHQHSEGNPLFAIAILEHLITQRFLTRDPAAASGAPPGPWKAAGSFTEVEAGVPDGLAQMIEFEIERLTPHEQSLVEAGSLMGIAFPAWAVAAALEQDVPAAGEACEALARRLHFVRRAGQDELPDGSTSDFYVFVHSLYRQVLYQRQAASSRAQRHSRIAHRLGELFAGSQASVAREMALHFEAAGDWRSAAAALRMAAHHAQQRQAHAESIELLENALRLTEKLSGIERTAVARQIRDDVAHASGALAGEPHTRVC